MGQGVEIEVKNVLVVQFAVTNLSLVTSHESSCYRRAIL